MDGNIDHGTPAVALAIVRNSPSFGLSGDVNLYVQDTRGQFVRTEISCTKSSMDLYQETIASWADYKEMTDEKMGAMMQAHVDEWWNSALTLIESI